MNRGYRLTTEAKIHLDEIIAFVAEDNPDAADRVLDALERAFNQLADMPEIGLVIRGRADQGAVRAHPRRTSFRSRSYQRRRCAARVVDEG